MRSEFMDTNLSCLKKINSKGYVFVHVFDLKLSTLCMSTSQRERKIGNRPQYYIYMYILYTLLSSNRWQSLIYPLPHVNFDTYDRVSQAFIVVLHFTVASSIYGHSQYTKTMITVSGTLDLCRSTLHPGIIVVCVVWCIWFPRCGVINSKQNKGEPWTYFTNTSPLYPTRQNITTTTRLRSCK